MDLLTVRRGHIEWPARSPDLMPLDFYFRSHLKSVVCRSKTDALAEREDRIRAVVCNITPNSPENVQCEFVEKLGHCQANSLFTVPRIQFCCNRSVSGLLPNPVTLRVRVGDYLTGFIGRVRLPPEQLTPVQGVVVCPVSSVCVPSLNTRLERIFKREDVDFCGVAVWPVPTDFIPYDTFAEPFDCITELPRERKTEQKKEEGDVLLEEDESEETTQ
ncbi:hypothetical protein NQ317_007943 [Molorchus minor]|uniref:Uncharacterized protein n=1 Tax=Molorchus minor TaxID=1323400 RepID=A0ABQ9IQ87_9CUCU|nr:hypothetical protein NQ317_007943 [Molorchus minor]